MRKTNRGCVIVSVLCCVSFFSLSMAEEHDEGVKKTIPAQFIGLWIEKGQDGKELGKITVSEKSIVWERSGADTELIKPEGITLSEDGKKIMFSSATAMPRRFSFPRSLGIASMIF